MKTTLESAPRKLKAAALVGTGMASLARSGKANKVSILAFHGLCDGMGDEQVLDWSLHLPQSIFRRVCAFLASNYNVIPLSELVACLANGEKLRPNSVVLTFDDGYASNYHLAFPVLKEFGLPATIFVATGFLDGVEKLWFQRADLALCRTQKEYLDWKFELGKERLPLSTRRQRQEALARLLPELKRLPDADLLGEIGHLEHQLGLNEPSIEDMPAPMRPMTWAQTRELQSSGLVDIGGHTHSHPVLSRCDPHAMRGEIFTCRDRIQAELGIKPTAFAYPNGSYRDYTKESVQLVKEAGFQSACGAHHFHIQPTTSVFELPRYGTPESVWEAEATVSGAYQLVKEWRQSAHTSLMSYLT